MIDDRTLSQIEQSHPRGLTSAEILDVFARHDVPLSEATLRKYVQLGLLPRSVRVGQKGKHSGSRGVYPVEVVRQILRIKQMMAESYTIDQIQREFLFIRSDLEELRRMLDGIFEKLEQTLRPRRQGRGVESVARDLGDARAVGKDLLARLVAIETQLIHRAKLESMAAS